MPTGCAFPVQPTPENPVDEPLWVRCSWAARWASMMDSPAPESITNGYGPAPLMQTLTSSATWPATVLTVIGMRSAPPPSATAPVQPAVAGGKCKVHQRLDMDTMRDARPDKQGGGRDQCGQRGGHPVQRPRPASRLRRTVASTSRTPRTAAAKGSAARRHPDVVRTVKRNAERWWAISIW